MGLMLDVCCNESTYQLTHHGAASGQTAPATVISSGATNNSSGTNAYRTPTIVDHAITAAALLFTVSTQCSTRAIRLLRCRGVAS